MIRRLLVLALLTCVLGVSAQDTVKTWRFGEYSFHSGYCRDNTAATILRGTDTIYYKCGGDGAGYTFVDTISLNNDDLPDFAYTYQMEEYAAVGMLVSQRRGGYKETDIQYVFEFEPTIYHTTIPPGATVVPMVLRDINRDGKRDMLIGILNRETGYAIPGYTETIRYDELRNIAAGRKPKKR